MFGTGVESNIFKHRISDTAAQELGQLNDVYGVLDLEAP